MSGYVQVSIVGTIDPNDVAVNVAPMGGPAPAALVVRLQSEKHSDVRLHLTPEGAKALGAQLIVAAARAASDDS